MQSATPASSRAAVVLRLFELLDASEVNWAVLRGADQLPDKIRYDIDLLVAPVDLHKAEAVVNKIVAETDWQRLAVINKLHYRCHILGIAGAEPCFLPIDLFTACVHRFYPLALAEAGLSSRVRLNNYWVVRPGFGAVVTVLKELMRHDVFKENSRAEVHDAAVGDAEAFEQTARDYLGAPLALELLRRCQDNAWTAVEKLAPALRSAIQRPRLSLLPDSMRFFGKNVVHHFRPTLGKFVVLLGPDGSGKSTIAEQLCRRLYQRPFKVCKHFEYNFRLLPELKTYVSGAKRLFGRRSTKPFAAPPGTPNSGMTKDHGPVRALIYILYYSVDLMLAHLVLRRLRGQSALIVFARYFYDYYYQRGYRRAPRVVLRLIEKLIPKPDLIVYIERSAEEIYRGKPELTVEEIALQQRMIRDLLDGNPNACRIDASAGVDATVAQLEKLIVGNMLKTHNSPEAAQSL
jgi:thymidylate kinase